tara:strand:- start:2253 stop:2879 length:627 start_codon:yes stop_codon:yes gene_type:complete
MTQVFWTKEDFQTGENLYGHPSQVLPQFYAPDLKKGQNLSQYWTQEGLKKLNRSEEILSMLELREILTQFREKKISFSLSSIQQLRGHPVGNPRDNYTAIDQYSAQTRWFQSPNTIPDYADITRRLNVGIQPIIQTPEFEYINGQMIIPAPQTFIKTTKGEELELIPKAFAETLTPEVEIITPDRTGIAFSVALIAVVIGYVILRRIR